ncbi:hypothetical protein M758_1G241400 [Ceratodon purpureus]|uniref:Uncharacterized protein n=1 Tax=Ceratodon purpureus TaxID=3225 RepID=A0A8T0JAS1_CERPU|nr:hypothetical protein KC19_1G246800 [Ceratodon purpureus]KAG0631296.1 hypothetical protein M758_1G241400 [Ceratodon purpureus]
MSTSVDTTTKLSYLLPTGTFLTFQVLAPLSTNNGNCGLTEKVLTGATLFFLVMGCILTSFTDSYTAPDGKVYNGFLTRHGLWVPGYEAAEMVGGAEEDGQVVPQDNPDATSRVKKPMTPEKEAKVNTKYIVGSNFVIMPSDYINAFLSAVSFLTLTMFTDPVSSCFYPNLSETVLKTLPVLLAALLSFFCSFSGKVRHGYGNSFPGQKDPKYTLLKERDGTNSTMSRRYELLPGNNETRVPIKEDEHEVTKLH